MTFRLVEPEIQPRAVKVEEPSEVPAAHQVTQLVDGRVVLEGVPGHEYHPGGRRGIDEQPRRGRGGRHRLFDKHVLPCRDRLQGKRRMTRRRRGDDHRVHTRQGFLDVGIRRDPWLILPKAVADLSEPLVYADDIAYPRRGTEHADVPRTPVTHPHDADPDLARSCPHVPPPGSAPAACIPLHHTRCPQPHLSPGPNGTPA